MDKRKEWRKVRIRLLKRRLRQWKTESETNRLGMKQYADKTIGLIETELERLAKEDEKK